MLNIIPIVPATIDLITKLNDGARPELEDKETFYVYRGEDEHAKIIDRAQLEKVGEYPDWMTIVRIYYVGD